MLTVYSSLESLATNFAGQISLAQFPIQLHNNGVFVVAEEAGERGRKRFSL
jgi:hypothetical protein